MALRRARARRTLTAWLLATLAAASAGIHPVEAQRPPLIFGTDAGIVLTFVAPDRTGEFDAVIAELRAVLARSEDPIRRQQAESWRLFRSPDPGPNGAVIYVSLMTPALKGASYDLTRMLQEALPAAEAERLTKQFDDCLTRPQSLLSLDAVLDLEEPLDHARGRSHDTHE